MTEEKQHYWTFWSIDTEKWYDPDADQFISSEPIPILMLTGLRTLSPTYAVCSRLLTDPTVISYRSSENYTIEDLRAKRDDQLQYVFRQNHPHLEHRWKRNSANAFLDNTKDKVYAIKINHQIANRQDVKEILGDEANPHLRGYVGFSSEETAAMLRLCNIHVMDVDEETKHIKMAG